MSNETATLVKLSAAEQAAAIKKGDVTSRELVEAHLKVIEAAEPSIKAFLKVSGDVALEQADAFDAKSAEDKAARLLHWHAEKDLADMCRDSWRWQQSQQ